MSKIAGKKRILELVAQYDPQLAEELATEKEENIDALIVKEIAEYRLIKKQKASEMTLEDLLTAWGILRDIQELIIQDLARMHALYFATFLGEYEHTAGAVLSALGENPKLLLAKKACEVMDKVMERMDKLSEHMMGGGREVRIKIERRKEKKEKEEEVKESVGGQSPVAQGK
jgi:hypothetical protein